ncbi:MAG: hypothetical protein ACP5O8_02785, partial [Candidatus Aenigmatarchaeota archaeon]
MSLLKPLAEIDELIEEVIKKSRNESFKKFSKYFEKSGLSSEEIKAVEDFLEKFCRKTGYV